MDTTTMIDFIITCHATTNIIADHIARLVTVVITTVIAITTIIATVTTRSTVGLHYCGEKPAWCNLAPCRKVWRKVID
jgi:hypothetical protein